MAPRPGRDVGALLADALRDHTPGHQPSEDGAAEGSVVARERPAPPVRPVRLLAEPRRQPWRRPLQAVAPLPAPRAVAPARVPDRGQARGGIYGFAPASTGGTVSWGCGEPLSKPFTSSAGSASVRR